MYDEYTATEFEYSYGGTDFCAHSCDPYDLLQVQVYVHVHHVM